jgi:uncharacterized tellurite resistance protein B-like protein
MILAKVIIAAAWADGDLARDEVNALKNLLAELGRGGNGLAFAAAEWAELEIYLHAPVGPAERARLVADLAGALRGPDDRALALSALDRVLRADRVITAEERLVAEEIGAALARVDLGLITQLARALRGPLRAGAPGPNRERYLDEFLRNRIYYAVRQRLGGPPEAELGIPADEAHRLALAGGLLARVAQVDRSVGDAEFARIAGALAAGWGIGAERAALVAEVALAEAAADLDYYRLTKEFADSSSVEERIGFLDALFAVAAADGAISPDESAEISRICASINLSHEHFVAAKRRARAG